MDARKSWIILLLAGLAAGAVIGCGTPLVDINFDNLLGDCIEESPRYKLEGPRYLTIADGLEPGANGRTLALVVGNPDSCRQFRIRPKPARGVNYCREGVHRCGTNCPCPLTCRVACMGVRRSGVRFLPRSHEPDVRSYSIQFRGYVDFIPRRDNEGLIDGLPFPRLTLRAIDSAGKEAFTLRLVDLRLENRVVVESISTFAVLRGRKYAPGEWYQFIITIFRQETGDPRFELSMERDEAGPIHYRGDLFTPSFGQLSYFEILMEYVGTGTGTGRHEFLVDEVRITRDD